MKKTEAGMEKIAVISDVNAGLDYLGYDPDIPVIRSIINFKEEHYIDGIEIDADAFYEKVKENLKKGIIPSTSAPTMGETMNLVERLIDEGYTDIIMYAISFKLSSIGEMVKVVQNEYLDKVKIHVVDTHTACYMQGYLAVVAKEMAKEGKSVSEILAKTDFLIKNSHAFFVVDDLRFLVKNGRLSGVKGFFANLLQIKPILEVSKDGKIQSFENVKTHEKAVERVKELIKSETKDAKKVLILVFHTCRKEDGLKLVEYFKGAITNLAGIQLHMVTPAVGAHIGCGILGVGYYILER